MGGGESLTRISAIKGQAPSSFHTVVGMKCKFRRPSIVTTVKCPDKAVPQNFKTYHHLG